MSIPVLISATLADGPASGNVCLELHVDVPAHPQVDRLGRVFIAASAQWTVTTDQGVRRIDHGDDGMQAGHAGHVDDSGSITWPQGPQPPEWFTLAASIALLEGVGR